jgi:23S rRNA (uracil1939-C5)-methyltransferase
MELEVRIERLGAQGDGVAQGPDGPLFVPFTLPGELVSVAAEPGEARAEPLAILAPSPERIAPICPHFGPAAAAPANTWRPVPISPGSASR